MSGTSRRGLLALSYVGFVSLGVPDAVLGAAWPVMRRDFGAALDAAGFVGLVTTGGVVASSALSGRLLARVRAGTVLAASTALSALALALSAAAPSWPWLLLAAAVAGSGAGAVDAALNGYVARNHSPRHMSWLHASWGVGATLGPLVVSVAFALERSWRAAYGALGALQGALAVAFVATARRWPHEPAAATRAQAAAPGLTPAAAAGVAFFFFYGALEASAGLWGASYLVATAGVSPARAGSVSAAFWASLTLGRVLWGAWASSVGEARLVRGTAAVALAGALALGAPGAPWWMSAAALVALGFALAPVYPLTMHLTGPRHGAAAALHLVGYQVAACSAGCALGPLGVGALAARTSLRALPPALAVCAAAVVLLERRLGGARAAP